MGISCKQIAEMVGVSRQAAASVLNGSVKCLVSKEKRDLILHLAKKFNYVRNNAARTLVKGKSGLVGILSGGFHIKRTGLFMMTMDRELRANGYLPVMIYTRSEYDCIAEGIRSLLQQNVDALIINGIPPQDKGNIIATLKAQGLLDLAPTLLTNCGLHSGVDVVHYSYDEALEKIISKAEKLNFPHAKSFFRYSDSMERLFESGSTIKECIKRLPLQTYEEIQILSSTPLSPEHSEVDILYQVRRSMENILPGTFYLCDTGFCAIQITSMLLQKYGKFPEDAAVIAFDHTDNCALFSPGISAVELNAGLFAQKCMELLNRRIRERNADFCAVGVPTAFIERDTF